MIEKIKKEAKKYFQQANSSHAWDHTLRVFNLCKYLLNQETADQQIVLLAALLHDIARKQEDDQQGEIDHAIKGAEMAEEILKKHGVEKEKVKAVCHCIRTHRFRGNKQPQTKEAKILFDADKLDSIGAVGIGRAFMFSGEVGGKLHNADVKLKSSQQYTAEYSAYNEFLVKLSKVKDRLYTSAGKELAKSRHKFMVKFFDRLNKEVKGEL